MVIKNRALELRGYKESKITALVLTHNTHNKKEIAHNLKFYLLIPSVTLKSIIHTLIDEIYHTRAYVDNRSTALM